MTKVEFHSGVDEPLRYACRLLRKAWRQGARVQVTAPALALQALDRELWTFDPHEFVPHVQVRPGQAIDATLERTPIWLCQGEAPSPGPTILINLGDAMPGDLHRFERVVEVVSTDDLQRQAARARWRDYLARGASVEHRAGPAAEPSAAAANI